MANDRSFLGRGWAFPPAFSRAGAYVEMVSGADEVAESLKILLATTPGERIMQELFGCDLDGVLFEPLDQSFINTVTGMVSNAILDYEPRIDLNKLTVSESEQQDGLLLISIDYTIRGTNSRYNMVYPYYLKEAATRV